MNYEANVAACIATFPELARGLDVNVRYDGCVLSCVDWLNIPRY